MTVLHKEVFGVGVPIVMLHGWAMHTGVWRTFARALATNRQVVCLDLPGHGLSMSVDPYTLEFIVDIIARELPEQECDIVGWSLGGNIALRLAEKYPQRINSLVLIACNPVFLKTDSWPGVSPEILKEFANNLQKNSTQTLLRFMTLQVQGRPEAKSSLKQIKVAMQECQVPTLGVLMKGLEILQSANQRKALCELKVPVLMILGGHDTLVPVLVAEHSQAIQPLLKIEIIASAGHVPFITHQKQLLADVLGFMQRVSIND